MKKTSAVINLIINPETLAAVHTCSFIGKNAIIASINNANKDEKF